jgi:hypothetical protein
MTVILPKAETTAFLGWSKRMVRSTAGEWSGTLHPRSVSFAGTWVKETDPGGGTNTCSKITGVTTGRWLVDAGNEFSPDIIGFTEVETTLYRRAGRAPCGFVFPQVMEMERSGGTVPYTRHFLGAGIDVDTVSSFRIDKSTIETKRWP